MLSYKTNIVNTLEEETISSFTRKILKAKSTQICYCLCHSSTGYIPKLKNKKNLRDGTNNPAAAAAAAFSSWSGKGRGTLTSYYIHKHKTLLLLLLINSTATTTATNTNINN